MLDATPQPDVGDRLGRDSTVTQFSRAASAAKEDGMRKTIIALAVGALALVGTATLAGSAFATQGGGGHTAVTLCHRTGSADGGNQHNGYDIITVDITSAGQAATAKGHNTHEQVGNGPGPDIIPAYTYVDQNGNVFNYPGKGLYFLFANGQTGADVLAAGCQFGGEGPP
jgi:hypothetical protein